MKITKITQHVKISHALAGRPPYSMTTSYVELEAEISDGDDIDECNSSLSDKANSAANNAMAKQIVHFEEVAKKKGIDPKDFYSGFYLNGHSKIAEEKDKKTGSTGSMTLEEAENISVPFDDKYDKFRKGDPLRTLPKGTLKYLSESAKDPRVQEAARIVLESKK